jgi:predicted permease
MALLRVFGDNLLPILLTAGTGYVLVARTRLSARPLAQVAFYVFSPCLIYRIIVENRLQATDLVRMSAFTLTSLACLAVIVYAVGRIRGWSRPFTAAVVLVVVLPNAGNFGLSASLLAFGEEGLAQASLYFVTTAVLSYTFGVLVASLGRRPVRSALGGLLLVPAVWAVGAAFAMQGAGLSLPEPVDRAVQLLAAACIPTFLVVLGMQLHGARWREHRRSMGFATAMRLVGGLAVALVLVPLFGLEGPARQAAMLQSAMPSAVIGIILASQFEVEPEFVTAVVFATTILSPLTLTPLLTFLGA